MLLDTLQQKSDCVHSTIYLEAFTHSAASLYWAVVAESGNLDPNCARSKSHGAPKNQENLGAKFALAFAG
jgi:hypothetical protein